MAGPASPNAQLGALLEAYFVPGLLEVLRKRSLAALERAPGIGLSTCSCSLSMGSHSLRGKPQNLPAMTLVFLSVRWCSAMMSSACTTFIWMWSWLMNHMGALFQHSSFISSFPVTGLPCHFPCLNGLLNVI
ncbi:hypothetical protein Y1Q_0001640 [Alligator mississippiensis]|uniref:Uncharacterized protein n=1 Tax=Alligator mississippiensis TaxID=8496 RepID=A0A151MA86_ALLMI|nr:hypothetical protein Y1Q_0001640 [Alligator mississippiensis]